MLLAIYNFKITQASQEKRRFFRGVLKIENSCLDFSFDQKVHIIRKLGALVVVYSSGPGMTARLFVSSNQADQSHAA